MDDTMAVSARRRGCRDWFVDTCFFLAAAGFGIVMSGLRLDAGSMAAPQWVFALDQVTGVAGCAALWLRRRHPVGLAVALVVMSAYSELVAGAMLLALFTVAVHRPPRTTGIVFGLSLVAGVCFVVLRPEPGEPPAELFLLGAALQGAAVGWGLFVHHRRRLVAAQRERAERAVTEARLRAEQAQHQAREAIAREIHDVLGHRLSLLSVHAGALEFRPDAPPEDIARAAEIIRASAHQALQDLREVIGVLRAPVGELPQPTLADIPHLVAESVRAGMRVDLVERVTGTAPETAGRTAYRIVQEALTNARKHAPGARVTVDVSGAPAQGLAVDVRNSAPGAGPEATPDTAADPGPRPASGAPPDPGPGSASDDRSGSRAPSVPEARRGSGDHSASPDQVRPASTVSVSTAPVSAVPASTVLDSIVPASTGPDSAVPAVPPPPVPGAGQGLTGLAERVGLAGGRLEHGPRPGGGWRLSAWLPWPS